MPDNDRSLVPEALEALDPAALSYLEWVNVGMALHAEGYPATMWDEWSRRDSSRYHEGECFSKWMSFGQYNDSEIGGGTIVKMARDRGFIPEQTFEADVALEDWDTPIITDPSWAGETPVTAPDSWDPAKQISDYLSALFDSDDIVGFVTKAFERDGRWIPANKGFYSMTAGEIISELRAGKAIEDIFGTPNEQAGAWIRINPLDGEGVKNSNIADFRYSLVESDELPIEQQRALIDELQLPCAAVVYSGGKSLHALVRIDAKDYSQYRDRVSKLYSICDKNGLKVDQQNKNPSRLSRLPGFTRGENRQYLVSGPCGMRSWDEWLEWIEAQSDDLPEAESLADAWEAMPELAPPLIDGVLRQGHKLLLAGPSKAGKSFALIELCVAIAEGRPWLGFNCAQGRVLYVNLELDRASCLNRFKDVYGAAKIPPKHLSNIDVWNLRGKSKPMDQLAPALIRRALKTRPIAVIIDPIYKVITGDENSADQMAKFCNQFDRVATEVGCAVIYCHHHSKGAQGGKRSIDRASGSGVFSRDPDAQLDMIQLPMSDDVRQIRDDAFAIEACSQWMDAKHPGWRSGVSEDDMCTWTALWAAVRGLIDRNEERHVLERVVPARARAAAETAWRIEGILREFAPFPPINLWFDYPLHSVDETGVLSDIEPEAEKAPWLRGRETRKKNAEKNKNQRENKLIDAINNANLGQPVTAQEIANYCEVQKNTVNKWIKNYNKNNSNSPKIKQIKIDESHTVYTIDDGEDGAK